MNELVENNNEGQGKDSGKKNITIIVNGSPEQVDKDEITYEQIVTLAFSDYPQHPERNYSVKYVRGHGNKPEGILSPGGKVKVKDGMEFTVTPTGQS
ncbi:hypothetical protein GO495_06510 [Chitinophaga oryziterrae]|uniref:Multi-ubiquitin domain-containing protein n=1 Tax=Chitinophaga oryziterrae TaxID=1031224 RepID=A0A6N8J7G9_9BACT|nr:multiubiquitin domain-containing protein [Chitinophaga oryziterrae]MVT40226.1 hypothetical protein [Chitinophaga oryziterrae]